MRIWVIIGVCIVALAGCAAPQHPSASSEVISAKAYRDQARPELTVMTMVNNRTGAGGHTALLINGSQRVIFDPAGSFKHPTVPERQDVLYGVSPAVEQGYKSAHARNSHHVVTQTFYVSPDQAETALALAQSNGPVAGAFCTNATTSLLRQVPGFQDIDVTFYPTKLMAQLESKPGVITQRYYENDAGDVVDALTDLNL